MILLISESVDSISQFITVLFIFLFVLAITYITTRWIANYQKGKSYAQNLEVIETLKITTNKFIQIVRVGDKYLAMAICKDTVTMLTELDKDSLVLESDGKIADASFKSVLDKVKEVSGKKEK